MRRFTLTTLFCIVTLLMGLSPAWASNQVYVVKQGQTLSEIAQLFHTTYQRLALVNGLADPNKLSIGQEIMVPGMAMVSAAYGGIKPVPGITASDIDLLARVIGVEAGGESYNTRVAVGAVVLNRVQSKRFPNNLRAVVTQPGQFPPVARGLVGRHKASSTSRQAALDAVAGIDPTNGKLFFNALSARTAHLAKKPGAMTIGRLVFY